MDPTPGDPVGRRRSFVQTESQMAIETLNARLDALGQLPDAGRHSGESERGVDANAPSMSAAHQSGR